MKQHSTTPSRHLALAALLMAFATAVQAGPRTSASYKVHTDTTDAGGVRASSAAYTNDGSVGGIVGISTVAAPAQTAKAGYIGQLYEVSALQLSASPTSVDEGGTSQLSAAQLLDDDTIITLAAGEVTWSVQSGPLLGIDANGLATADLVSADSAATAQGSFAGQTGLIVLTVNNLSGGNPPEIFCADKIVANAPAGGTATVRYGHIFAIDPQDGPVPVTCSPPATTAFPVGSTPVTCSATDSAGNTTTKTFEVCVLEIQLTPVARTAASISQRGDAAPGAGGTAPGGSGDPSYPAGATMFAYNDAFLNNAGNISLEATLKLAGTKNLVIFSDAGGSLVPLAVKDTGSPGGPNYVSFNELAIGDNGVSAFVTRTTAGDSHVTNEGTATTLLVGSPPPGLAGQPQVDRLSTPALSIDGRLFSPARLRQGTGSPAVTVFDDSLIWDSDNGLVAREGEPAQGLPTGILYSHLASRVVANDGGEIAFTGNLTGAGSARTAVWSGDPNLLSVVARRDDVADGTGGGAAFASFQAESISPAGAVVLRATVRSGGVTSANNEGLWSDRSGQLLLVVREDHLAPCGQPGVRFGRFTSIFIDADGSIVFYAFLKGLPVNSSNDGSVWRSDPDGSLHLIAREGGLAHSTDGAVYAHLDTVATNNSDGVLILARLVSNTGDTTNKNDVGLWRDRGAADLAPVLVMRRGDTVVIGGQPQTVSFVSISYVTNTAGGTGGYGRVLNDSGTAVIKLSLSGLNGGVFTLP